MTINIKNLNLIENNNHYFWLLCVSSLLIVFNWYFASYDFTYLVFWCAALSLAGKRRKKLILDSDFWGISLGFILISWLLFRSAVSSNQADVIARLYPLISVLGVCLLATKPSKIIQFWREIIIVSITAIPWEVIFSILPASEKIVVIDAKISRLILWYVGFDVKQAGDLVILPTGTIQIAERCSSFSLLGLMWQFCIVICLYFVLTKKQKLVLGLFSTVIAFGINGIRLCLMALLVANQYDTAFDYWHGDEGAEIFTTIAILVLAGAYWLLVREKTETLEPCNSNNAYK